MAWPHKDVIQVSGLKKKFQIFLSELAWILSYIEGVVSPRSCRCLRFPLNIHLQSRCYLSEQAYSVRQLADGAHDYYESCLGLFGLQLLSDHLQDTDRILHSCLVGPLSPPQSSEDFVCLSVSSPFVESHSHIFINTYIHKWVKRLFYYHTYVFPSICPNWY